MTINKNVSKKNWMRISSPLNAHAGSVFDVRMCEVVRTKATRRMGRDLLGV